MSTTIFKTSRSSLKLLALIALCAPACGGAVEETTAASARQALTTASPADVVSRIQAAARQLQAATQNLNDVLAGAYSAWPSKREFAGSYTIRGYRNDLEALNAAVFVAAAYAQGAYVSPALDFQDRMQLGGAYTVNPAAAGAYVIGANFGGAYVLPTGGVAGAYVAGAYSSDVMDKVILVNRE